MGFVGPERDGLLEQLGVELDERGNVARDAGWATTVDRRLRRRRHGPGPEPHRVGDRRGPLRAAAVDRYLMGETALPSPLAPTDLPLR